MFDLSLFLGFAPDKAFQKELSQANSYLAKLFIGKEEYLQEVTVKKKCFLGKPIAYHPTVNQLEDLEKHLLSLLTKLTPNYSFSKNPPILITVPKNGK